MLHTQSVFSLRLDDDRELRLLEDADARELDQVICSNQTFLSRWMPWAPEQTLERTRTFIRDSRRQLGENQGFQAAIVERGQIVGVIGFHRLDWVNRATSIGYWIAEDRQGRGTMTAAARALIDHAFRVWGMHRVEVRAGVENHRSQAVARRLGFVQEGVLRHAERIGDRYVDHVVYAMLSDDWDCDHQLKPGGLIE